MTKQELKNEINNLIDDFKEDEIKYVSFNISNDEYESNFFMNKRNVIMKMLNVEVENDK